jgi:hypothetical protein
MTGVPPMTATILLDTNVLYDRNYFLWLNATAEQLKQGRFNKLDLENLVEEIDSMVKSQKNGLKSLLIVLLEHLLKLAYWESERERNANHWKREIIAFRNQINRLLSASPSLQPYLSEIFEASYTKARRLAATEMGVKLKTLPETSRITLEQTLEVHWFPIPLDFDL